MQQVFAEIKQNVQKEAEQLVNRAKRVAEREIQHAREEAEAILNANKEVAEKEAKLRYERARARIEADIRKRQLEQQQMFVQKVFDKALEKFKKLPRDEKYEKWLKALIAAALIQIPKGNAVISCNEQDASIVKKIISSDRIKLSDKFLPISAGVVITSEDGRLKIDCSIEAEMRKIKDELRDKVLNKLSESN